MAIPSEEKFVELFAEVFGTEKLEMLIRQYPFRDIYGESRVADFVMNINGKLTAIEIDGEAVHNERIVSDDKYNDDQVKQNSMINYGWDVYRWSYRKLLRKTEEVKDEMRVFFGEHPNLRVIDDYLPLQKAGMFELKTHQQEALDMLQKFRDENKTIALITHATGTGKTVTAIADARILGGRTLFLAQTKELVFQARDRFASLWLEKNVGVYCDGIKETNKYNLCATIQSIALNLFDFNPNEFDYIIIDEAHHAASETYQKIISYFYPKFLLGLTATPYRTDDIDLIQTFQEIAHKLDIKTAVEIGELVSVRCFRVDTNVDISNVRIGGFKYNHKDLEEKLIIPERNQLIVDTYLKYAQKKPTVIFCISRKHAEYIANELKVLGIKAAAVDGSASTAKRKEILTEYENGNISVLCACDLLNEGWDSPKTTVLFMARPTMSRVLYEQQLGRGMRLSPGKESLIVFDFVDNANRFKSAYSLHKLLGISKYREFGLALASKSEMMADEALYIKGEKPSALIDFPISVFDYTPIDIFNFQDEIKDMISEFELVRQLNVQSKTIHDCIKNGKIVPDLPVPISESRVISYFKKERVAEIAKENGWIVVSDDNRKKVFIEMIQKMDMDHSYKPVFIKAFFKYTDESGRVRIVDLVSYFIEFYSERARSGLFVEQPDSIYAKGIFEEGAVQRSILGYPFRRFEEMSMFRHSKNLGTIEMDNKLYKHLTQNDVTDIITTCDKHLESYFMKAPKRKERKK